MEIDNIKDIETDKKENVTNKKRNIMKILLGLLLVGGVLVCIIVMVLKYSPSFDATVTHFLDTGHRVGNNIYGYIDVPDGFTMIGSFDPGNEDYLGGKDGIAEGVQLKNEDGTVYIVISLVTADKKRKDYIGFGDGQYCLYRKKNYFCRVEEVRSSMVEELWDADMIKADRELMESFPWTLNGLSGSLALWKGEKSGKMYQYQTFVAENPEKKGAFHCITVAFTEDTSECTKYMDTFSLSASEP